ncbi:MAG: endonuclease III domain-containing protein [Candidatus Omnitrophica bacterium]|nr:endonuclease III domain-containing protein [Candidatus Omnitrophota bacterium]
MGAFNKTILKNIYQRLFKTYGPQHWWPGETKFEIIVGAILTQNTNWQNVEKAIANLKQAQCLNPKALKNVKVSRLTAFIRPSGYFNIKAKRLKNFINFLFEEYDGNLSRMSREETGILRQKLLAVNGIGPETADSILLYAFDKPVFVVDAYTKRIFSRHHIVGAGEEYHSVQRVFTESLPADIPVYNEYHALIVRLAKDFCKTKPECAQCPLNAKKYYSG